MRLAVCLLIAVVIGGLTYAVVDKIVDNQKKCSVTQSSQGDGIVKINGDCEVIQTP